MAELKTITQADFLRDPGRYELRSGRSPDAPDCPYGNKYEWLGFDKLNGVFVRFSKSLFKRLIQAKHAHLE